MNTNYFSSNFGHTWMHTSGVDQIRMLALGDSQIWALIALDVQSPMN